MLFCCCLPVLLLSILFAGLKPVITVQLIDIPNVFADKLRQKSSIVSSGFNILAVYMSEDRSDILVAEGIREIETIADNLPGVVILHDLRDWSITWMSANGLRMLGTT